MTESKRKNIADSVDMTDTCPRCKKKYQGYSHKCEDVVPEMADACEIREEKIVDAIYDTAKRYVCDNHAKWDDIWKNNLHPTTDRKDAFMFGACAGVASVFLDVMLGKLKIENKGRD